MAHAQAAGPRRPASVVVIAPGGGTGVNKAVYQELGQDPDFHVSVVGRSRAEYDHYPESWSTGRTAPNLVTFAEAVLLQGHIDSCDCLVVGSRGGQIVLPTVWEHRGDSIPPAVIINGGCAMKLPNVVKWPSAAVTFLLIGGQDYFRGETTVDEYIMDTRNWVPLENSTTAILYVEEMKHMPQAALLRAILPIMVNTLLLWKATRRPPLRALRALVAALQRGGWSGRLCWTMLPGEWSPDVYFNSGAVQRLNASVASSSVNALHSKRNAIESTRERELKALWQMAAENVMPQHQASTAADRFLMAALAAKQASSHLGAGVHGHLAGSIGSLTPRTRARVAMGAAPRQEAASMALPPGRRAPMLPASICRSPGFDAHNVLGTPLAHARQVAQPQTPISHALGIGSQSPTFFSLGCSGFGAGIDQRPDLGAFSPKAAWARA